MSGMNPEQQRFLLASYGPDWMTADLLLSDDGIKDAAESLRGGGITWDDQHTYFQTSSKGIGVGHLHSGVRLILPWSAVKAHRASLPSSTLATLAGARTAYKALPHYPVHRLPQEILARRVGPSQDLHPDDRAAAAEHHAAYVRDVLNPWRQQQREASEQLRAAIAACLPLADDHEPTDLLDFLATLEASA